MEQIADEVRGISDVNDPDQLVRLDAAAVRFFRLPDAANELTLWFELFERFPEADGEVFWSVLHGLESVPGSDRLAVESVVRSPARFPVMMLNRMLNAGQSHAGSASLIELLERVAGDSQCPASVRESARRFVEYQRRKQVNPL